MKGEISVAKHLLTSPAALALQVEVVGSDLSGQQFIERTQTLTITRDGATILLTNKLAPESEVIVRNVATNGEALARVVGHIKEDASGHVYGIALMDLSVNLWGMQLSAADSRRDTVLECNGCHAVRAVTLSEIEMEILESKQALTRHCGCSSSSTLWKQTAGDVSGEQQKISPRTNLGPEPVAPHAQERRRDKRTAMKPAACIRYSGQEEIVACEDLSRSGFRFKSRKQYPEGVRIEAAVPYVESNVNIFVSARIVYRQELSATSHRHGATYIKTSRNTDQNYK
jgi:hypothetical protein